MTLDTFLAAIQPAFPPNMCKPDVMAILKRASVILNTRDHIYVKLAARPEIERFDNEGSYITEEATRHLNAYYESGVNRDRPPGSRGNDGRGRIPGVPDPEWTPRLIQGGQSSGGS